MRNVPACPGGVRVDDIPLWTATLGGVVPIRGWNRIPVFEVKSAAQQKQP
jgi:hypothetical protein